MSFKLRCYYEVLGIEKIAKADEIKTAYRKLALIWHPDKNQNQLEIAEERFKEINNAHTVLSDPNERKWYDDHREAILRGGKGGTVDDDDDDEIINLWPYFNTACFTSFYDNDETGFYRVYTRIFEIIDKEEEGEEMKNEYHYQPTKFGDSKTPISEVLKFYSFWKDFVTKKKFTSADLYHLTDAPNRQIKRLMEKENLKERAKARQQYNERVRHLATFIYNHDKRIIEYQKKCLEESERKQKELEEIRIIEEEERQKAIKAFKQEKQREYQLSKEQGLYKNHDDNIYQDESENSNYCVICDKAFKSEGQLENHQNSNKHKQELARIRKAVSMDDELPPDFNDIPTTTTPTSNNDNDDNEDSDSDNNKNKSISNKSKNNIKSKKSKKKSKKAINPNMFNSNSDEYVHGLVNKNKSNKNKKKSKSKVIESESEEEEEINEINENENDNDNEQQEMDSEDEDDLLVSSMLKNFIIDKKNKNKKEYNEKESEYNKVKENKEKLKDSEDEKEEEKDNDESDNSDNDDNDDDDDDDEESTKKSKSKKTTTTTTTKSKGKAKEKREKKAEKKQQTTQSTVESSLFCSVCKGEFSSRNKLFQHIKETGHAIPLTGGGKKKK